MYRYRWTTLVLEIAMILAAVIFALPLWMLISVGFRPSSAVAANPLGAPTTLFLQNFVDAWQAGGLARAFANSFVITAISVLALIVVGASASYYFARASTKFSTRWYMIVIAGMMVPFQIGVLPLYRLFTEIGLAGTPISVIVFSAGIHLPITVLLYTGFMRQIPAEYEEAARVDGASSFRVFRSVVVPLLLPVTGTVIILDGLSVWNDFFTPLIYVGGTSYATVPVRIYGFVGEFTSNWGEIFAGLLMASIPVLALFFIFQRYMIRSFGSGLKG